MFGSVVNVVVVSARCPSSSPSSELVRSRNKSKMVPCGYVDGLTGRVVSGNSAPLAGKKVNKFLFQQNWRENEYGKT